MAGAIGEARIPIQDAILSSTRPPPAEVSLTDQRGAATIPASSCIRHLLHDFEILCAVIDRHRFVTTRQQTCKELYFYYSCQYRLPTRFHCSFPYAFESYEENCNKDWQQIDWQARNLVATGDMNWNLETPPSQSQSKLQCEDDSSLLRVRLLMEAQSLLALLRFILT